MVGTGFILRFLLYGTMFVILLAVVLIFLFLVSRGLRYFVWFIRNDIPNEAREWKSMLPKLRRRSKKKVKSDGEQQQ